MGTPTLCLENWPKFFEVEATFEAGGGPIKNTVFPPPPPPNGPVRISAYGVTAWFPK